MMESATNKKSLKIFIFGGGCKHPDPNSCQLSSTKLKLIHTITAALGGLYSHLLSASKFADVQITIACRGNYDIVSQSGFKITTSNWGNHICRPHRVIRDSHEIHGEAYDYVIVTTKVLPQASLPLARFPLQPDVPIVLIQNGVGIEKPYREAFPTNPIASGVAYITASQPSLGHILQDGAVATMTIGLYDRADNPTDKSKIQYLAALFDASGFPCAATDEIHVERWGKLGWNGSWNVVCAATNLDTQSFLASSPQAVELVEKIIREVAKTANAAGVKIDADTLVEDRMGWTLKAPPIVPSMLQDARKGLQMELEAYCGNVWRIAESVGVEVPCIK
jgi:2-dehydropantoate 2-reductase